MILPDHMIVARLDLGDGLSIEPRDVDCIQPSSVDLKLGQTLITYEGGGLNDGSVNAIPHDISTASWFLFPGQFALGATLEWIEIPDDLVGVLVGKSSLARDGLQVEAAGYVDPGWHGNLTIELKNLGPLTIVLRSGMRICQIRFELMAGAAAIPYGDPALGSHYQNSVGPVESRGVAGRAS